MTAADGLRFTRGSGPWFEYTYDYMGRRVRRKVYTRQADTTWSLTHDQVFVYDGWSRGGAERRRDGLRPLQRGQQGDASRPSTFPVLVLDATDSNAVTRTFTWGLDLSGTLQGAGGIGGLLRLDDTDDVYFYTCDANGNISELIDDSGNTDAHYEYTPFGSQVVATGPCAAGNPFRFSTKYHEEQIELYYYGFRYYSPDLGRWLNRDPIGEAGGWNLYVFTENDPPCLTDFLGYSTAHEHCEKQRAEWERRLRNPKTAIGGFWERLSAGRDCPIPATRCECCGGDATGYGGYWDPTAEHVVVCENNLSASDGWSAFGRRLTHELVHAAQHLCFRWKTTSCRDSICKEIQAYANEHVGLVRLCQIRSCTFTVDM
jgi:RHS repeat-associated protein